MKIFIALLLLLGNVYIHAQSNYNELFTRGEEFRSKGLYTKALPYYEKAEKVVKANSHKLALWRVMAESYKETADYNKSRLYYEQILHTFKNFPYKDDVLLNLSDIYLLTGYYEKVIELLSPLNLRKGEDKRLINLSNAYAQTGNSQNALALLDTAISQHATSKDSIFRSAIQNKGYILWNIKRHKEAFELLSSALSLYTENDADRYLCLGNLAIVESELGDSAKEQSYFKKALAHIDEAISWQQINIGNTHPDYIISLRKKAEILLKMNALPEATTQFKIYFEKEKDYIISNFAYMTEQERINFWNTKKKVLAECYATEGFDPDFLFDVAVFSKSVLLQTNINIWQLVSGNQEYTQLYERLHELRLLLRSSTGKERQTLQKEYEQQERLLMNRVNSYKFFLDNLKVNGKDISRALTNQSDKAIEFIQYLKNDTTRYAALVMQKNKAVRFIPMFTLEEIEQYTIQNKKNFGTLKEAIYSRKIIDKNHLYSDTILGKKIWDNLLGDTPSKTNIYFSPEGIFHLLGIEYLCFDRPDCKIFRLSSTRRLCEDRGTASKPSLLLLGGLNYNDDSAVIQHPDTLPDRSASEILGRDMLPPVVGQGYTYLNGSLAEVNNIRTLISPNSCQLYQYSKGTEDIVKQDMQKYNMIHISTHGFCFDYQIVPSTLYLKDNVSEDLSLSRCGIILSGANRTAKQDANNKYVEDGILTARELCNLNLTHVELAVLSACQTGLGRITADGIAGLPRGLKKAGANAILVSLWDVNDHATQLLMTQFYRNLLKGKNKIESLHDAQTYVRNYEIEVETGVGKQQWKSRVRQEIDKTKEKSASPQTTKIKKYQDPYYWAAFFLIDAI